MDRVSEAYRYTETETETETEMETIPIRKTEREILELRLGKRGWAISISSRTELRHAAPPTPVFSLSASIGRPKPEIFWPAYTALEAPKGRKTGYLPVVRSGSKPCKSRVCGASSLDIC